MPHRHKKNTLIIAATISLFWIIFLFWWTKGFSSFTTDSYILKSAGNLPRAIPGLIIQNQFGQIASINQFKNRYILAAFVYLDCSKICPIIMAKYFKIDQDLQSLIPEKIVLLTISFNPNDTVAMLNHSWQMYHQPRGWYMTRLTEPSLEMKNKEMQKMGAWFYQNPNGDFNHTGYLFLIDSNQQLIQTFPADESNQEIEKQIESRLKVYMTKK